jgi:hypothetical protein
MRTISACAVLAGGLATASCGSSGGGDGGPAPAQKGTTGDPCTRGDDCATDFCITDETFKTLTEGQEANIPGGYCSKLSCMIDTSTEECGEGGYCYDLGQYFGAAIGVCFHRCETVADCRTGYLCTDAAAPGFEPLPSRACVAPDLLCLIGVPLESCPAATPTPSAPVQSPTATPSPTASATPPPTGP